jgi:hypothetical protein
MGLAQEAPTQRFSAAASNPNSLRVACAKVAAWTPNLSQSGK